MSSFETFINDAICTMRQTEYKQADFAKFRRSSDASIRIAMQDYNSGIEDAINILQVKFKEFK